MKSRVTATFSEFTSHEKSPMVHAPTSFVDYPARIRTDFQADGVTHNGQPICNVLDDDSAISQAVAGPFSGPFDAEFLRLIGIWDRLDDAGQAAFLTFAESLIE